ncbi:hypothetical protein ['Camptotheca acuminata' phytoplasma]|uniref:hypothetical protein n=1 Tax='Camptotheca acuminata' phytoplasma TaxID=3239192 RepID=UPI00351A2A2E
MQNEINTKKIQYAIIIFLIIATFFVIFYFLVINRKEVEKDVKTNVIPQTEQINKDSTPESSDASARLHGEIDFFKKVNVNDETKCFYKIDKLLAHSENDFKFDITDLDKILTDKPQSQLLFKLKNDEIKPNSSINVLKDSTGIEKKLFEFKNKPNLQLKINKQISSTGNQRKVQFQLLSDSEVLLASSLPCEPNLKINLVTTNLRLFKNDKIS